jgi:hypothetical protein
MSKTRKPLGDKVKAYLARHGGNAEAAVTELLTDNQRYRDRLRTIENAETPYKPDARVQELERENERLEGELDRVAALVPAQGSVVLTAADAQLFNEYKALGKVEDLKKTSTELPALRDRIAAQERVTEATKAAELLGWNAAATVGLVGDKGLVVLFVDGKDAAGKDAKIPHVRPANDEKAATKPLADWQKENAAYMTAALTAKGTTTSQNNGTPFTPQASGTTPPAPANPVDAFIAEQAKARSAAPNPLFPKPAAAAAGVT